MTATNGSSRPGFIVAGVIAAVIGVAAAVVLMFVAPGNKQDDAVTSLAPAPVGCETSLEFDSSGTYYVFAEARGEVGDLGECENDERSYDVDYQGDDLPAFEMTMVDSEGQEVGLSDDTSVSYDRSGQLGQSLATVRISEAGEYQLRVDNGGQEELDELMVRVGSDPNVGTTSLTLAGVAAFVVGTGLGVLLIGLSRRGGDAAPAQAAPAPTWQAPYTGRPTAPPTGPPSPGPPTHSQQPPPAHPPPPGQAPPGPPPTQDQPPFGAPPQQPPGGPTGLPPSPPEVPPDDQEPDQGQPPRPSWGPPST